MSNPPSKALSMLRSKHLRALEQITSLTQKLSKANEKKNNKDAIEKALKESEKKWKGEKDTLNLALTSLRERLAESESNYIASKDKTIEFQNELTELKERLKTQKSAFITASDEISKLRNELGLIKTKHQSELEKFANDSVKDSDMLKKWRLKAEKLEREYSTTNATTKDLTDTIDVLKSEIKRLQDQRKRDNSIVSEQSLKLQQQSQQKIKELEKKIIDVHQQNERLKQETEKLICKNDKKENALCTISKQVQLLKEEVADRNKKIDFMSKSLEQAKSEWNLLSQENASLKQRLDELNKLNGANSKFAKFVAIKEENLKLSNHNAHLKKVHRRLRKQNEQFSKFRVGAPGIPRRPETNAL
jgi:chromosome segregation ATPase